MIKIEKIYGFDGVERTLEEIEENYYSRVTARRNPFDDLTAANINIDDFSDDHTTVINLIRDFNKYLVLAKPKELQTIIDNLNELPQYYGLFVNPLGKATDFSKAILRILDYNGFRGSKKKGVWLAQQLNIKSCPYCNSTFTLVVEGKKYIKARFQLDHYFSKDIYPFLSLSLYNLIPSCANCNLSKGKKRFNLNEYVHPYEDSFESYFKFKLTDESVKKVLPKFKVNLNDIDIEISNKTNVKVNNHNDVFDIEALYKRHKDIVQEIHLKSKVFTKSRRKELLKLDDGAGNLLFPDEATLNRYLIGNYINREEINNRPLAKFMQDFAKYFKLIS